MFARMTFAAVTVIAFTAAAAAKPVTLSAETNLRAAPGTKSEVVTLIPKGSQVEVSECDAGWCKVKFGDKEGFAIGRNVGEAPAQTAAKPQGQSQANLQKLRRGYEGYFNNGQNDVTGSIDEPDSADAPPPPRTAQNTAPRRTTPPRAVRPQYDDDADYYDDADDYGPADRLCAGRPAGLLQLRPLPALLRLGPGRVLLPPLVVANRP